MTIRFTSIASAVLAGVSHLAMTPALAAQCTTDCLPPTAEFCSPQSARPCGALRDDSIVEVQSLAPNLEATLEPVTVPAFQVSVDGVPQDASATAQPADLQRQQDVKAQALSVTADPAQTVRTLIQADTLNVTPMLSIVASRPYGAPGEAVTFFTAMNYARFTDFAEVLIYRAQDSRDGPPHVRIRAKVGAPVLWTPAAGEDGEYRFVLRVYGANGRYDETRVQSLRITRAKEGSDTDARTGPLLENQRVVSNIRVKGAKVTVSGRDIPAGAMVEVYGAAVPVSADGSFVTEQIVPEGTDSVAYTIRAADGTVSTVRRPVEIKTRDHFFVAIADLTGGHRSWDNEASVAALQGVEADTRNTYLDGRLAFYYKGKLNQRYSLTASADTTEQPLKDLFNNFDEKDGRSLLRRLDPDRSYPVYGDDSTTVEDAPTSGRFYLRVEDVNSHLMWGNFQTALTGTEFAQFSRGLYGANLAWQSEASTAFGERLTQVDGFAADPGTIGAREDYASTGTSLYYLRRQDISQGSERVFVEVRDRDSGLVLDRRELSAARDYEVNYLQGRLMLREPVPITADTSLFVRDSSLAGNPVYLVVTYEYSPGLTQPDTFTIGGRATHWLGDHVQIGGSAYHQGQDQARQDLLGTDIKLRYAPGTYLKAEFAHSNGAGESTSYSGDGGYGFNDLTAAGGSADAYAIEAAADLADVNAGRGRVGAYWRQRQRGFSSPGALTGSEAVEQAGATIDVALSPSTALVGKADVSSSPSSDKSALEAGVRHDFSGGFYARAGLRADDRDGVADTASETLNEVGRRTDGAVTLGYRSSGHVPKRGTPEALFDLEGERQMADHGPVPDAGALERTRPWSVYAFGQATLDASGTRRDNDRLGVGGDIQLDQRTRISAELSDGDRGNGVDVGADYAFSDRGSLNLAYALAAENSDGFTSGRLGRLSATSRYRFTSAVSVFAEGRYDHGSGPTGLTQAYGVDFAPAISWRFGMRYERGLLADAVSGDIQRHAVGANVDYTNAQWRGSMALEYRSDEGNQIGSRSTWATRNSLSYAPNRDWKLYGKANFSISQGLNADTVDADYYELVAAAAYRPVDHDRLNLLGKYTFLYDLPSGSQSSGNGEAVDYAQRSHVFAIDGTYQLTPTLAVGAKYALRTGELKSTDDVTGQWFSSTTHFVAVRADVRIIKAWDALAELRRLSNTAAQDSRTGALVGVYRHIGPNMKIGAGYNFTDFSDDLTDLSYNEHGFFFNIVAMF